VEKWMHIIKTDDNYKFTKIKIPKGTRLFTKQYGWTIFASMSPCTQYINVEREDNNGKVTIRIDSVDISLNEHSFEHPLEKWEKSTGLLQN
jgi:hypothetical protein